MFFAFKENTKKDALAKLSLRVEELSYRIRRQEEDIYFLKNPPKFKIGDLVTIAYSTEQLENPDCWASAMTEEGELDTFIIVQVSKKAVRNIHYRDSVSYSCEYQIIDSNFKKRAAIYSEKFLKLAAPERRKKK